MENAVYYTLSTIAQTIVAGIAIVTAFALFRFQTMESRLSRAWETIMRISAKTEMSAQDVRRTLWENGSQELLLAVRDARVNSANIDDIPVGEFWGACDVMRELQPNWDRTITWLRGGLYVSAADILWCIVFLPFVPLLCLSGAVAWAVCGLAIVLAFVAVFTLVQVAMLLAGMGRTWPARPKRKE